MSTTLFAEVINNAIPFVKKDKDRLLDSITNKEFNELAAEQIKILKNVASPICTAIRNQLNNGTYQGLTIAMIEPIRKIFAEILEELKQNEEFKQFVQENDLTPEQLKQIYHGYLFKFQNTLIAGETSPAINLFLGEIFAQVAYEPDNKEEKFLDQIKVNLGEKIKAKIKGGEKHANTPFADYKDKAGINGAIKGIMEMPAYMLLGESGSSFLEKELQKYAESLEKPAQKKMIESAIKYLTEIAKPKFDFVREINSQLLTNFKSTNELLKTKDNLTKFIATSATKSWQKQIAEIFIEITEKVSEQYEKIDLFKEKLDTISDYTQFVTAVSSWNQEEFDKFYKEKSNQLSQLFKENDLSDYQREQVLQALQSVKHQPEKLLNDKLLQIAGQLVEEFSARANGWKESLQQASSVDEINQIRQEVDGFIKQPTYKGLLLRKVVQAQYGELVAELNQNIQTAINDAIKNLPLSEKANKINVEIDGMLSSIREANKISGLDKVAKRLEELQESPYVQSLEVEQQIAFIDRFNEVKQHIAEKRKPLERQDDFVKGVEEATKSLSKTIIEFAHVINTKSDAAALVALRSILADPGTCESAVKDISNNSTIEKLTKIASLCESIKPQIKALEAMRGTDGSVGPGEVIVPNVDEYQALLKILSKSNLNVLLVQMLLDGRLPVSAFSTENADYLNKLNGYLNGKALDLSGLHTSNTKGQAFANDDLQGLNTIFNSKRNDSEEKRVEENMLVMLQAEHRRQQLIQGLDKNSVKIEDNKVKEIIIKNPNIRIKDSGTVQSINKLVKDLTEYKISADKFKTTFAKLTGVVLASEVVAGLIPSKIYEAQQQLKGTLHQLVEIKQSFSDNNKQLSPYNHYVLDKIKSIFNIGSENINAEVEIAKDLPSVEALKTYFEHLNNAAGLLENKHINQTDEYKEAYAQFKEAKHQVVKYAQNVLEILQQQHAEVKRAIKIVQKQAAQMPKDSNDEVHAELKQKLGDMEAKMTGLLRIVQNMDEALKGLLIPSKTVDGLKAKLAKFPEELNITKEEIEGVKQKATIKAAKLTFSEPNPSSYEQKPQQANSDDATNRAGTQAFQSLKPGR